MARDGSGVTTRPLSVPVFARPSQYAGARVAQNGLGIIGVSLLIVAILYVYFEYTRSGIAMRAASMNRRPPS